MATSVAFVEAGSIAFHHAGLLGYKNQIFH